VFATAAAVVAIVQRLPFRSIPYCAEKSWSSSVLLLTTRGYPVVGADPYPLLLVALYGSKYFVAEGTSCSEGAVEGPV
jgi:hypothetical protein